MESSSVESDITILSFATKENRGVARAKIEAVFTTKYNRQPCAELNDIIKSAWEEAIQKNSNLFDGSKFRLAAVDVDSSKVSFKLGLTSYSEFVGTNCLPTPQVEEWQVKGQLTTGNAASFLANPLGLGALVRTADDRFVFIRRSSMCGEAQGLVDRPGGHPEPENLNISLEDAQVPNVTSEDLVNEIFDSVMGEVRDEVGIPLETLSNVQLMGIVYNRTKGDRPSAEFYMTTSLASEEINDIYKNGQIAESYESTEIFFVDEQELRTGPTIASAGVLAPAAVGCIRLYNEFVT